MLREVASQPAGSVQAEAVRVKNEHKLSICQHNDTLDLLKVLRECFPKILHTEIRANRFNLNVWKRAGGGESSPLSLRCHLHRSPACRRSTYKCGQTMCSRIARSCDPGFRLPCSIPSLSPSLAFTDQAGRLIKGAGGRSNCQFFMSKRERREWDCVAAVRRQQDG